MADVITLGLEDLTMGDIAGDGGMGTVLASIGKVKRGSCSFVREDGESVELYSEQSDDPEYTKTTRGKIILSFTLMSPDADQLVKVLGGTKVTGPPVKWQAPLTAPDIEQSLTLTSKTGASLSIVRGKVEAKENATFTNNDSYSVDVKVTVLTPTKAATAPYELIF